MAVAGVSSNGPIFQLATNSTRAGAIRFWDVSKPLWVEGVGYSRSRRHVVMVLGSLLVIAPASDRPGVAQNAPACHYLHRPCIVRGLAEYNYRLNFHSHFLQLYAILCYHCSFQLSSLSFGTTFELFFPLPPTASTLVMVPLTPSCTLRLGPCALTITNHRFHASIT